MSFSFFLQKTWAASGRTTTVLAAGTTSITLPYGREVVTLYGQGQPGNSPVPYTNPGTPYTNAGTPYTNPGTPYTNPGTPFTGTNSPFSGTNSPYSIYAETYYYNCGPGSYTLYSPGCGAYYSFTQPGTCMGYPFNVFTTTTGSCSTTPGTPYTNPGTPYTGTNSPFSGTNSPFSGSNSPFTGSNSPFTGTTSGNAGTPATVLGVAFPGGAIGGAAPYVPATVISYYAYPDNTTYPVTIPSSTNITLKIE